MNYSCNVTVQQYGLVIEASVQGVGGGRVLVTEVILVFIGTRHAPLHSNTTSFRVKYSQYIYSKGKEIPLQGRCGPEGVQRYSSTVP